MPENTGKKQEQTLFQKGHSGNPKGRPKGKKNKSTLLAQSLLENDVEAICTRLLIEAKKGNIQAIKIVMDRILPARKELPIALDLPEIKTPTDLLNAISVITSAVGSGIISPSEGEALSRIIDINLKAVALQDFEKRLILLEETKKS
jgi:Family of unknown function (DUF5681)